MDNLFSSYQQILNLQTSIFSKIEHEDAIVALVYKVTEPNGKESILKICEHPNHYFREVYFLKHLSKIIPVPKIVQLVEPRDNMRGAVLMECLPGALLNSKEITKSLAIEMGRCLALIHANRLEGYGDVWDLSSNPHDYLTPKFEEGLNECKRNLPSSLIDQCNRYYHEYVKLLESVDGPCIVHRDYRPGNLMVYKGVLQGVIDWAGGRASFAEEDFCSIEHGEWSNDPNMKNSFLTGYASVRPIPDYARLMTFLRLNKAVATIGFTVKRGTWDNSSARLYNYNRQFLEKVFS